MTKKKYISKVVPLKKKSIKDKPSCGLCGKKTKLIQTECCGNWICDDADKYVMFSYARNSCYRNHDRYILDKVINETFLSILNRVYYRIFLLKNKGG